MLPGTPSLMTFSRRNRWSWSNSTVPLPNSIGELTRSVFSSSPRVSRVRAFCKSSSRSAKLKPAMVCGLRRMLMPT
jgi:hypothetical protein